MGKVIDLKKTNEYQRIEKDVESFVQEKLAGYSPCGVEAKTIHDSVWGSVGYEEWEMQIIDSPLLQRLRDIHQVGLAMLTYPAARHSRFEHSLGVAAAAKRMCERINSNSEGFTIDSDKQNIIAMAALLHDVGHCFYSHLSESIYGELKDVVNLRNQFYDILDRKPKPHEMLSFIIVNTETFREFFMREINFPNKSKLETTLFADIGCMIIGAEIRRDGKIWNFQTAIINGPFDADKLDYIRRDSLTAGLALQYDIERLYTKIGVQTIPAHDEVEYRLIIHFNGVTAIEELTFCKIMLFSYIYYHQKVLITETMIRDYAYAMCDLNIIGSISDFLRYTDSTILELSEKQGDAKPFSRYGDILNLKILANNIRIRRLPKRCFEVSQSNVMWNMPTREEDVFRKECKNLIENVHKDECYDEDMAMKEIERLASLLTRNTEPILDNVISDYRELTYEELLTKRQELYQILIKKYQGAGKNVNFSFFDIYLVFPKLVNYGTSTEAVVLGKDKKELMTINDFVKLDDWAGSFNSNKWRGYVFVDEKIDRSLAFEAAEEMILQGKGHIKNPMAYLKGVERV